MESKQLSLFSKNEEFGNTVIESSDTLYQKSNREQKKDKNRNAQWDKFYTLFMFDEIKYHRILKDYIKQNNLVDYTQIKPEKLKEFKNDCYIKDGNEKPKPLGDEKHIFRYRTLYKLFTNLGNILSNEIISDGLIPKEDKIFTKNGFRISVEYYNDKCEWIAELDGTYNKSIKERVLLHIQALRKLRKGLQ